MTKNNVPVHGFPDEIGIQRFKVNLKSKPCITNVAFYDVNDHA